MIREFIEYLYGRGRESAAGVEEHLDHPYHVDHSGATPLGWPPLEPFVQCETVELATLSGAVAFLTENIDGWELSEIVIKCAPSVVAVEGILEGAAKRRPLLLRSTYSTERWGGWHPLRNFRLEVRRCFENNDERQRLLDDCGAFRFESADVREERADGAGISTTDKRDRVAGGRHTIENPVYSLAPWRTFPEAGPQVTSPFLLEIRGGDEAPTEARLTDCGGDAWRAPAAAQVGEHVKTLLGELDVAVVW